MYKYVMILAVITGVTISTAIEHECYPMLAGGIVLIFVTLYLTINGKEI